MAEEITTGDELVAEFGALSNELKADLMLLTQETDPKMRRILRAQMDFGKFGRRLAFLTVKFIDMLAKDAESVGGFPAEVLRLIEELQTEVTRWQKP